MKGEVFVNAAEASNEMIFEGPNGAFRGIATMHARRSKLEVNILIAEELFEGKGAFIVQALELRA
jgi:hypothetical protein